jgi:Tol biopolymer transport system component
MRLLLPLVLLVSLLAVPAAASASYPGTNGRVVYSASPGPGSAPAVFTANPDGSDARQVTPTLPSSLNCCNDDVNATADASPSADGKQIAYVISASGIWIVNADGTNNHMVIPPIPRDVPERLDAPKLSPDGRRLLWSVNSDEGSEVDIANADGTGQRILPAGDDTLARDEYAEFSPDGRTVTFLQLKSEFGCETLRSIPVTGGRSKILWAGKGRRCLREPVSQFDWAPNGKSIAFYAKVTANKSALVTLRLRKKKLSKPLTKATKATYAQFYAPDGRSIAITPLLDAAENPVAGGPTSTVPVRGGTPTPLGPFSISGWAPQPTG